MKHPARLAMFAFVVLAAALGLAIFLIPETSSDAGEAGQRVGQLAAGVTATEPAPTPKAEDDAEVDLDAAAETAPAPKALAGRASATKVDGRQAPAAARRGSLPKKADGRIDFKAMGMTGKESGAELLRTEEERGEAPVEFQFTPGDEWTVESYYRQMQSGKGDVWSPPVRWRFRVDRQGTFKKKPCLVFVVTMLTAQGKPELRFPPSTFYVSKPGYQLLAADMYEVRGGKGKMKRVAFRADGKSPSRASGSIVPFDLPRHGVRGAITSGGGLPRLDAVSKQSKKLFPRSGELVGSGGDYVEVEFTSPVDGTKVRQRWAKGDMRWPAVSISAHRRSYRRG